MKNYNLILLQIYNNIFPFIRYRGLQLIDTQLSDDEFNKKIQINKYILIKTEKQDSSGVNKLTNILLFHNNTDYSSKTAEFKKLMNSLDKDSKFIIISKDNIIGFINKHIEDLQIEKSNINNYTYMQLSIIIPEHINCVPHRILSIEESEELLNKVLFVDKKNLQAICINDPMIIWIGGNVGDVIEITRTSEITGESIAYRRVTNDLIPY
jgi:DNA-directed RNA polymerase subunit H (RpoH/RPB5)